MYEQYTDEQIVEMLKPKLAKLGWEPTVDHLERYPSTCEVIATIYRSAYIRGQLGRSFIIGEKKEAEPLYRVGDKVEFAGFCDDNESPENRTRYFPVIGTIGKVAEVAPKEKPTDCAFIQWPKDSTTDDDLWACPFKYLKKVENKEKWVPANVGNVKKGDKVRMIDKKAHKHLSYCYPKAGTIGTIEKVNRDNVFIQWPRHSTSCNDQWWANYEKLEVLVCE